MGPAITDRKHWRRIGNALHLIGEIVPVQAGIQITHVSYKGSGPAVAGLLAKDPTFVKRMKEMSFDPIAFGAQEFTRLMNAEWPQWTAAIKAAGIATKKD